MAEKWDRLIQAIEARTVEWDANAPTDLVYRAVELAGEVGEAEEVAFQLLLQAAEMSTASGRMMNVVKKLERERHGMAGSRATTTDLSREIGDVLICAIRLALKAGINPWDAVVSKFNEVSIKLDLDTILAYQSSFSPESERYRMALLVLSNIQRSANTSGQVRAIAREALQVKDP